MRRPKKLFQPKSRTRLFSPNFLCRSKYLAESELYNSNDEEDEVKIYDAIMIVDE